MSLPKTFLAYPSDKSVADSMLRLMKELRKSGTEVVDWRKLTNPGLLFRPILTSIDGAGLLLAESTYGNPNVLFELGYAIARGKATYQLTNRNAEKPRRLPALDLVRHIEYGKRQDIIDFLKEADLSSPSLADQLGLAFAVEAPGRLYFVPSRYELDLNETVWKCCQSSPFECATIDKQDSDYDSLMSQGRSIAEAKVFVTVLVNQDIKEHWDINAQLMLLAGMAEGMGKDVIVLAQQPLRRLLDLGDSALAFESESEAEFKLDQRLSAITKRQIRAPEIRRSVTPPRDSPLTGLFFGSLDARADFDLADYFIRTPEFRQAESGKRHLFVGSKGSGKTANFENLKQEFEGRNLAIVSIAPADFEFPRLTAVFDEHLRLAHWRFVYGSFWRFILITEIMRAIRAKFMDHLLRQKSEHYAKHLLEWLEENGGLLDLDFVSRVTAVLSKISEAAENVGGMRSRLEELLQIARLYKIEGDIGQFAGDFEIRMLIDDLDRNWSPLHESANRLILALLNELQALMETLKPHFKAAIFVRKDVFDWLVEEDQEILKRDPADLEWNAESLEILIASRIGRHLGISNNDPGELWAKVFPEQIRGRRTQEFIMDRTLLRPRDVIQFCQKATERAQRAGRSAVSEEDVFESWEPTGELMLAQIETEYASRYPQLGALSYCFFEAPAAMEMQYALRRVTAAARGIEGVPPWIEAGLDSPISLIKVLYSTGIVGIRTTAGATWFIHDRPFSDVYHPLPRPSRGLLDRIRALFSKPEETGQQFIVVHPAFQDYLQCQQRGSA